MIDEAAVEAGCDPREIRRLYDSPGTFGPTRRGYLQGPPEQWVDELLPLATERGVSGFTLVSDDPSAIERYGREVAPALAKPWHASGAGPPALETRRRSARPLSIPGDLVCDNCDNGCHKYG
jgi:hypothetical protein